MASKCLACVAAALLLAGAAQAAMAPAPSMTAPIPGSGTCLNNSTSLASGPAAFSATNSSLVVKTFSTACPTGTFITAWHIMPAVSMTNLSYMDQVYGVQGVCSDKSVTQTAMLPTDAACPVGFTEGALVTASSGSTPPAFWNTYYRSDAYLDGLLGVGSFSGRQSIPGVFGCPGNSYVTGFMATAQCTGFTSFQLVCQNCQEALNQPPYGTTAQGPQGNPSSPQPNLVCAANPEGAIIVDAVTAGAQLMNYTTDSTPPAPSPLKAPSPGSAPMPAPMPKMDDYLTCASPAYITKWYITYGTVSGAVRVTNISALCSDYTNTTTISIPSTCPIANVTSSAVLSDSNPPAWWNLFIKTDGYLDSFLNVGAPLSIGTPQVVSCPANGYILGLQAITSCNGFEALQIGCSSCNSTLTPTFTGGPNSPTGKLYNNGGFQLLKLYSAEGVLAGNITRNTGNNLPSSVVDGPSYKLLASFPASGNGLYPNLTKPLQAGFIQGIYYILNSTDSTEVATYENVTLNGANGRRLLQSNQSVFVNMEVTTVAAESVGQLLSSQNGFEGIQRYFLQNPQIFSSITLTGPPTITTYSASNTSVASSPKTSSGACTGSHHFGHWCHTSISRGGIIAIIVIFSLLLLALLIAIPVCLMGMARSRRSRTAGRPTGAAGGATPWNDPAGTNANVSVANPNSARK